MDDADAGHGAVMRRHASVTVVTACIAAAAIAGCTRNPNQQRDAPPESAVRTAQGGAALREVTLPDLSRVDPSVQMQAQELYLALDRKRADPAVPDAELGLAYGELAMLLHAAEYYEAAEPAYLNAQALTPGEPRWPYHLGHVYKSQGDPQRSIASFRRAAELNPSDVAPLVWLGRAYLEQGQPETAAPFFEKALAAAPETIAAMAGLGQAALVSKDYRRAVQLLEEALALDPSVASLHSPLAMAYRGLGDTSNAEAHLEQWRNTEILVPDPMRQELDLALQSGLSYELRGVRALEARDFAAAIEFFRKGAELAPPASALGRSLRHKLGTALALSGNLPGAMQAFEETIRLSPKAGRDEPAAKAHYSLGLIKAGDGRSTEAIEHLLAALAHSAAYLEARVALGDVLRRSGRFAESLTHYQEALRIDPRSVEARFGYAMALVRMERYRDARDWLEEAVRVQPDEREFANALARILAAAPDASVRDGRRAMTIVQQLYASGPSPDLIETMAMVAAELGDYTEAVAIQREVMDAARQGGQQEHLDRMAANLRRYEKGQPSRTPWPPDHPVHRPGM